MVMEAMAVKKGHLDGNVGMVVKKGHLDGDAGIGDEEGSSSL